MGKKTRTVKDEVERRLAVERAVKAKHAADNSVGAFVLLSLFFWPAAWGYRWGFGRGLLAFLVFSFVILPWDWLAVGSRGLPILEVPRTWLVLTPWLLTVAFHLGACTTVSRASMRREPSTKGW